VEQKLVQKLIGSKALVLQEVKRILII